MSCSLSPTTTVQDGAAITEKPDGSVSIDLPGRAAAPSVVDDKFYANLATNECELNITASELLEGIRRHDESRREHLEMLSEGFKLLGLVIETATATSVSPSVPLEGMSTVRHALLLAACSLFQANAMGEMLPAAGPMKVGDDQPQKPKSADMMGRNGAPALRWHQPVLHSAGAASAGTSYAGSPPSPASALPAAVPRVPPAAAGMRPLRPPIAEPGPAIRAPAAAGPMPGVGPGASRRRPYGNARHFGRARARRDRGRA
ncbi:hypothetical protein [Bradyrhizobium sp. USDA 10063]